MQRFIRFVVGTDVEGNAKVIVVADEKDDRDRRERGPVILIASSEDMKCRCHCLEAMTRGKESASIFVVAAVVQLQERPSWYGGKGH